MGSIYALTQSICSTFAKVKQVTEVMTDVVVVTVGIG